IPGKAGESRLIKLIRHAEEPFMPEKKEKLSEETIGYFAKWIDAGAPYDKPLVVKSTVAKGHAVVTEADRKFWSFAPLSDPAPPSVKHTESCIPSVERFLMAAFESTAIATNPLAGAR